MTGISSLGAAWVTRPDSELFRIPIEALPRTPGDEMAETETLPLFNAVTSPLASTLAIFASEQAQWTSNPVVNVRPSESVAVAASCSVSPTIIDTLFGVTVIAFTVTEACVGFEGEPVPHPARRAPARAMDTYPREVRDAANAVMGPPRDILYAP